MTPTRPWLVFSDDWGRHPSSCQHLIRNLLDHVPVTWVNTIGMRPPRLDWSTAKRGMEKIRGWLRPTKSLAAEEKSTNLSVIAPIMWPSFRSSFIRGLNKKLLLRALRPVVAAMPSPPIAVTTLPLVADLVGQLPVHRWVYYCVDDFGVWPGYDGETMRRMERDLVPKCDSIIAVSETLQRQIAELGKPSHLLTHGVDLKHWLAGSPLSSGRGVRGEGEFSSPRPLGRGVRGEGVHSVEIPPHPGSLRSPTLSPGGEGINGLTPPLVVFWGVIDRRMDMEFLRHLSVNLTAGTIVLVGPREDPDPAIFTLPRVVTLPPWPYARLPELAASAAVLIMPYADMPATRAMQPLKLKEYLATGKPTVVRRLPATAGWADAADLADTPSQFTTLVNDRLYTDIPQAQQDARMRLERESWLGKAAQFEDWVNPEK